MVFSSIIRLGMLSLYRKFQLYSSYLSAKVRSGLWLDGLCKHNRVYKSALGS